MYPRGLLNRHPADIQLLMFVGLQTEKEMTIFGCEDAEYWDLLARHGRSAMIEALWRHHSDAVNLKSSHAMVA